jgi:hypothetical protein
MLSILFSASVQQQSGLGDLKPALDFGAEENGCSRAAGSHS